MTKCLAFIVLIFVFSTVYTEGSEKSKEPRPQGGALKPKIQNQTEIPNQVRDDKKREPNPVVMLNLFQHLVCFFLLSADASFIPVHRTGFSGAILIK